MGNDFNFLKFYYIFVCYLFSLIWFDLIRLYSLSSLIALILLSDFFFLLTLICLLIVIRLFAATICRE